ncbi:WD40-repeat-containing domain protein [Pestalotiopsis sp. NC0098]|nr:WD40-repeat-containing domain protein [Pestalotiopsis sp. NC0098]
MIYSTAISHNELRVASGAEDGTIKLWDATSGICLLTMTLEGYANSVLSVAFSHDGQRIASGSVDSTVKVWDATSGICLLTLEDHANWFMSVAFSHDGQRIASGSYDNTVKVWDVTSGNRIQELEGRITCKPVAISHDGSRIGAGSYGTDIEGWEATSDDFEDILHAREAEVYGFWDPDDAPDCSCSSKQSHWKWGISRDLDWVIEDGKPLFWLPYEYRPRDRFAVTVTGSMIAIGCQSGQVLVIGLKDSPSRSLHSQSLEQVD